MHSIGALPSDSQPADWLEIFEAGLEMKEQAFLVFDEHETLIFASAQACELFNLQDAHLKNRSLIEILPQVKKNFHGSEHTDMIQELDISSAEGPIRHMIVRVQKVEPHRRSRQGLIVWLNEKPDERESDTLSADKYLNAFRLLADRINVGFIVVNPDGFIHEYNENFKTLLNLPGDWSGRNLFTFPPIHQYEIAPFLFRVLQSGEQSTSQIISFTYPGLKENVLQRWYGFPVKDGEGKVHGALFCVLAEQDTSSLTRLLTMHKEFIEKIIGFIRGFEPGSSVTRFFEQMSEFWAEQVFASGLQLYEKRGNEFRSLQSNEVIPADGESGQLLCSKPYGLVVIPENYDTTLVKGNGLRKLILFRFSDEAVGEFVAVIPLPGEKQAPDFTDEESLKYLHEILHKLFQKAAFNERLAAEMGEAHQRSNRLAERTRNSKERVTALQQTNASLHEKVMRLEKEGKEARIHLEEAVEKVKQDTIGELAAALAAQVSEKNNRLNWRNLKEQLELLTGFKPVKMEYVDINKLLENTILKMHRRKKLLDRIDYEFSNIPEILFYRDKLEAAFTSLLKLLTDESTAKISIDTSRLGHVVTVVMRLEEKWPAVTEQDWMRAVPEHLRLELFAAQHIIEAAHGRLNTEAGADHFIFIIKLPVS